jgi:ABC-type oligopeptide transport system ATPase subunit
MREELKKSFGAFEAAKEVSFEIEKGKLSDGQRQRVAFARALAPEHHMRSIKIPKHPLLQVS